MTKEQIIEILAKIGANVYIPYDVKCNIADAILALHRREFPMAELVDTGTDEEIEVWAKSKWNIMENSSYNDAEIRGRIEGAKAIRDGKIIKRNNSL